MHQFILHSCQAKRAEWRRKGRNPFLRALYSSFTAQNLCAFPLVFALCAALWCAVLCCNVACVVMHWCPFQAHAPGRTGLSANSRADVAYMKRVRKRVCDSPHVHSARIKNRWVTAFNVFSSVKGKQINVRREKQTRFIWWCGDFFFFLYRIKYYRTT